MRPIAMLLLLGLCACGKHDVARSQKAPNAPTLSGATAAQSKIPAKMLTEMHMIPIPKDKGQLKHLLAMGYTIHEDHMHPPGVKECPFDKTGGGAVE